jgi:hypothetical protein
MNPVQEIYDKAKSAKQNGIMVMSVDYILQQFERESEFYRLAYRSPLEASKVSDA